MDHFQERNFSGFRNFSHQKKRSLCQFSDILISQNQNLCWPFWEHVFITSSALIVWIPHSGLSGPPEKKLVEVTKAKVTKAFKAIKVTKVNEVNFLVKFFIDFLAKLDHFKSTGHLKKSWNFWPQGHQGQGHPGHQGHLGHQGHFFVEIFSFKTYTRSILDMFIWDKYYAFCPGAPPRDPL